MRGLKLVVVSSFRESNVAEISAKAIRRGLSKSAFEAQNFKRSKNRRVLTFVVVSNLSILPSDKFLIRKHIEEAANRPQSLSIEIRRARRAPMDAKFEGSQQRFRKAERNVTRVTVSVPRGATVEL